MLADQVGVDFFGVGEHHRAEFADLGPEIVLAAIAARTKRIHLGTAVTVLSSDDPVACLRAFRHPGRDLAGRAEVILGRGSFIESFPLFGYDLARLRGALRREARPLRASCSTRGPVTWQGTTRAAARRTRRVPARPSTALTGLGRRRRQPGVGRPRRALRLPADARDHRRPARSASRPFVDLYHRALEQFGQPAAAGRRPLARPRRRHRRAGARRGLAALSRP